jgi:hypothetical protein
MICAVHQPNFIPYLGFFHKAGRSDVFILYDTAQYSKNDFTNRNRIKTPQGPLWLTVPVSLHLGERIGEVKTAPVATFCDKHLKTIAGAYKKAPFFADIFPLIEQAYAAPLERIVDLTIPLIRAILGRLFPRVKIVLSSEMELDLNLKSTEALVVMMQKVGADTYLSGPGAREYLEEAQFEHVGVKVEWQEFHHPSYPQLWGGDFVANLSVIDALFMLGFEGVKKLIDQ